MQESVILSRVLLTHFGTLPRTPPSWILKNVNSFCKNEAILTKFEQHTQGHQHLSIAMGKYANFPKSKMAAAAILDFDKC